MQQLLTQEQLQQIAKEFGLKFVALPDNMLKISDGVCSNIDKVWWKCKTGPELVKASEHWDNMQSYPNVYCIEKPGIREVIYV